MARTLELDTIQFPSASNGTNITLEDGLTKFNNVNVDINGGNIDGTAIGANATSTGAFTTISASSDVSVNTNKFNVTASSGNTTIAGTLAVTGQATFTGGLKIGNADINETELEILDGATLTTTELNYVDGVTSAIQTQIDSKQAILTGGASSIASSDLTASRALIANGSGKVAVSDVTSTELGYLDGVTSAIQTQINGKDNYSSWTAADHDGTTYTITSGDTLTFKEGAGIDVNFTADDELTISSLISYTNAQETSVTTWSSYYSLPDTKVWEIGDPGSQGAFGTADMTNLHQTGLVIYGGNAGSSSNYFWEPAIHFKFVEDGSYGPTTRTLGSINWGYESDGGDSTYAMLAEIYAQTDSTPSGAGVDMDVTTSINLRVHNGTSIYSAGLFNSHRYEPPAGFSGAYFDLGSSSKTFDIVYRQSESTGSDKRIKDNIKGIEHGLDIINDLRPVQYNLKDGHYGKEKNKNKLHYGLIAQEVKDTLDTHGVQNSSLYQEEEKKVFSDPENDEDYTMDTYWGIDYTKTNALLIKAVQELSAKNEALTARVASLETA